MFTILVSIIRVTNALLLMHIELMHKGSTLSGNLDYLEQLMYLV